MVQVGEQVNAQNYVELIWKISLSCAWCWIPHHKILFLARVMIFWKSRFAYNYSTVKYLQKLKIAIPENCSYVTSWENHPSKSSETWFIPSLGEYLQIWFGDLINFTFFGFYWPKIAQKWRDHIGFLSF